MIRNPVMEQHFCQAIRNRVLVELRYEDDMHTRLFAPYVVYRTSKGKLCAFGMQVRASNPSDRTDPHNFDLAKVGSINLTTTHFEVDPRFSLTKPQYRNRICPI